MADMNQYRGTGRRKTSVARVRLIPGGQGVVINGKAMTEYFGGREILAKIVEQPLVLTEL
ncbi:BS10 [Fusobacterium necrophorum subsp. necrophorum]|nr:BS10 [Fusobacterium necrophorum subsp. necrophorum]